METKKLRKDKIMEWCRLHKGTILFVVTFLAMDFFVRLSGTGVTYFPYYYPQPTLFSLLWIALFYVLVRSTKGILRGVLYWLIFLTFFIMALTNAIYYGLTGIFFSFHIADMASEGSGYMLEVMKNAHPFIYLGAAFLLVLSVYTYWNIRKEEKYSLKVLGIGLLAFFVLHLLMPITLGFKTDELKWNSFSKSRSVYENFTDYNRSMRVSGFYEYTIRNLYMVKLKPEEKISEEEEAFLKDCYSGNGIPAAGLGLSELAEQYLGADSFSDGVDYSAYEGIFKGKNVIFLQLEGIDSWLITKETMPNLYALQQESLDFTNHFSLYTGGGSTFNSEFAVNTGFVTPVSYTANAYTFNNNACPNSMPRVFSALGYRVNAFHMNHGAFYSRDINYKSWGYEAYNGLLDITDETEEAASLDRTMITDKTFYKMMFQGGEPFVHYLITYSNHTPFSTEEGVGKLLADEQGITEKLGEEASVRLMAAETDRMVGLLLQALKENGLYDNTVLVCYSDHYLYTMSDQSVIARYKDTTGNLINRTSFFIWSSEIEPVKVNRVTMQMNILPTVLYLFGIAYDDNQYLFANALATGYTGIACFADYSWYDGHSYVENGVVVSGEPVNDEYIAAVSTYVQKLYQKNDWTLRYDYLRHFETGN